MGFFWWEVDLTYYALLAAVCLRNCLGFEDADIAGASGCAGLNRFGL